jgi:hypothetical protein
VQTDDDDDEEIARVKERLERLDADVGALVGIPECVGIADAGENK